MIPAFLSAVIAQVGATPREFALGWAEGRARYLYAPDKDIIGPSLFARGSWGHAASQAAVAFHQARGDGEG